MAEKSTQIETGQQIKRIVLQCDDESAEKIVTEIRALLAKETTTHLATQAKRRRRGTSKEEPKKGRPRRKPRPYTQKKKTASTDDVNYKDLFLNSSATNGSNSS